MNAPGEHKLQVGHGLFDPLRGELCLDGRTVRLRPRTAALLSHLVQHADQVVRKDELMQAVWPDVVVTEDSLVQCVKEIRHALGEGGHEWIRTLPRRGYVFVGTPRSRPRWRRLVAVGALALAAAGAFTWKLWPASPTSHFSASTVVLPIENVTGDPAQDRLADDLTEAISDALTRGRGTVVAPSTARTYKGKPVDVRAIGERLNVRYVVQGSLRLEEARPVLRLRLADAATSVQLWQQDLNVSPAGLPELREDMAGGVIASLTNQLVRAEARRSGNMDAMKAAELVKQARGMLGPAGSPDEKNRQAQELLEQAVRLNDDLGVAWALLSATYLHDVRFSARRDELLKRASEAAERAVRVLPNSDGVVTMQARVRYEQLRLAEALRLGDRALELNPGNAVAMGFRGYTLLKLGRPQDALAQVEKAMRMSPRDPFLASLLMAAGVAHLQLTQDGAAVDTLVLAAKTAPEHPSVRLMLAGALGAAGRIDESRTEMAHFQRMRPGYTLSRFRATDLPPDASVAREQRQRLYEGLRRAGMPE